MNGIDYAGQQPPPPPLPNKGQGRATQKSNYLFVPVHRYRFDFLMPHHWSSEGQYRRECPSMWTINFFARNDDDRVDDPRGRNREVFGGHLGGNLNFDH